MLEKRWFVGYSQFGLGTLALLSLLQAHGSVGVLALNSKPVPGCKL